MKRLLVVGLFALLCLIAGREGESVTAGNSDGNERGTAIQLPTPGFRGLPLEETLRNRRSQRSFSRRPLSLAELSELLFAAQGITGRTSGSQLRTAPSAGACYPFEIYAIIHRVEGLKPGIYHYLPGRHSLESVRQEDLRSLAREAALGQSAAEEAAVLFVMAAVPERITSRYGARGYRYIDMEAGHISQNIYLEATSLGLGSVAIGAFSEKAVNTLIGLPGRDETAVYLHAVGALTDNR